MSREEFSFLFCKWILLKHNCLVIVRKCKNLLYNYFSIIKKVDSYHSVPFFPLFYLRASKSLWSNLENTEELHVLHLSACSNSSSLKVKDSLDFPRHSSSYIKHWSGEVSSLKIGTAQVGVRQVAPAQVCHLEVDVSKIKTWEICSTEIETLRTKQATPEWCCRIFPHRTSTPQSKTESASSHLTAQLGLGWGCQQESDKLLARYRRMILSWLWILLRELFKS